MKRIKGAIWHRALRVYRSWERLCAYYYRLGKRRNLTFVVAKFSVKTASAIVKQGVLLEQLKTPIQANHPPNHIHQITRTITKDFVLPNRSFRGSVFDSNRLADIAQCFEWVVAAN